MHQQTAWSQTDVQRKERCWWKKNIRKVNMKLFLKGQRADDETSYKEEESKTISPSSGNLSEGIMGEVNPGKGKCKMHFLFREMKFNM